MTRKEHLAFTAELSKLTGKKERRDVMELMTSWERKGLEKGLEKGFEKGLEEGLEKGLEKGRREAEVEIIQQQLRAKLGPLRSSLSKKIESLSQQRLKRLASELLKFQHLRDLERWL